MDTCANPNCDMPRAYGRARCRACDMWRRRHDEERPERYARPTPRRCAIVGCDKHAARRVCHMHQMRAWRERRAAQESTG